MNCSVSAFDVLGAYATDETQVKVLPLFDSYWQTNANSNANALPRIAQRIDQIVSGAIRSGSIDLCLKP